MTSNSVGRKRGGNAPSAPLLNIANVLTVVRLLLVPVVIVVALHDFESVGWRWITTAVFVVGMGTDYVDGHLARSRNLVTDFGKIADPIADKAFTGSIFIVLSIAGVLWWWVTILILVREVGITILRFLVIDYGVLPADRYGKAKTLFQTVALTSYLLPLDLLWPPYHWVSIVLMAIAFGLTMFSGANYLVAIARLVKGGKPQSRPDPEATS